jgi:hypothetical protein
MTRVIANYSCQNLKEIVKAKRQYLYENVYRVNL